MRSIRDSSVVALLDFVRRRALIRSTFCTLVSALFLHNVLRFLLLASEPITGEPGTPIRLVVHAVVKGKVPILGSIRFL